jgi:hypothetical protein
MADCAFDSQRLDGTVGLIWNCPVQFKSWPGLDARGDILTCKGVEAEADQAEGQPHPQGRSLVHALQTPRLPVYRTATLFVVSNAGGACRWIRNAQVVITKAVLWHCHSEPSTALSIGFGRVRATAPQTSAAITNVVASTFRLSGKKVMAVASRRLGAG